ncbi:hypothetical protein [Streptomyces sp. 3213.3]|nr:hypothetical protein [Streptomyces sp. 3213.3]
MTTGVQSHVTDRLRINTFSFTLAASGNAYTAGDGLWRINRLTSR